MALHILFNRTLPHSQQLQSSLNQLQSGLERLNDLIGTMSLMLEGDGSSPTHFEYLRQRFGFETQDIAMAAYQELLSLQSKLITNGSITNVNAAMLQAFNKFR